MHCGKDEETEGKSAKNALLQESSQSPHNTHHGYRSLNAGQSCYTGPAEVARCALIFIHFPIQAQKHSPIGGKSCGKPNAINHPQVRQKWEVTPPVNIRCGKSMTLFHIFLYVYPRRPLQKIGGTVGHGPWPIPSSTKSPSPPRAPSMANLLGALGDLRSEGEAYCPS